MAQELRKKTIEEDVASFEGFDEEFLKEAMDGSDEIADIPEDSGGAPSQFSLMTGTEESYESKFSFDDFDSFGQDTPASHGKTSEDVSFHGGTSSDEDDLAGSDARRRVAAKKLFLIVPVVLTIVISAGIFAMYWLRGTPHGAADATRKVLKRAVPIEYHQEEVEFLVIANTQNGKDLVSFGLELSFAAVNAYEDFRTDSVVLRDMVYDFLLSQQPAKNTYKYWQSIMENKLLAHLKATIPRGGVTSIRVTHMDRL